MPILNHGLLVASTPAKTLVIRFPIDFTIPHSPDIVLKAIAVQKDKGSHPGILNFQRILISPRP